MNVERVTNAVGLRKFLKFTDKLYKDDKNYVPQMKADLKKVMKKLLLDGGGYTGLMVTENGRVLARLAYTVAKHKQYGGIDCGFFSHFECVNDQKAADMILGAMCDDLKKRGVTHVEGTYFPFDQDNRRGILVEGFDKPPVLLTSYNKPYYKDLLEGFGMGKDFDTLAYAMTKETIPIDRYRKVSEMAMKRYGYYIEPADFSKIDTLVEEVGEVIKSATTDDIFQDAPTIEAIRNIVGQWKSFLKEEFCLMARRASDHKLIGTVIAVPDFNQVFKKMKGSLNPVALVKMLYYKNKITTVRGLLQYVLPEYQNRGVALSLYIARFDECDRHGVTLIEAGTMMENNVKPNAAIKSAGGVLYKRYRLYGKKL